MRSLPDIVKQLIIINVLFFLGSMSLGNTAYDLLALHYPQNPKVCTLASCNPYVYAWKYKPYPFQYVWTLDVWGTLAQMWGRNKFLFFYLSTGLGAAALQLGINYFQISTVWGNSWKQVILQLL
ncbi:MAG: hypothetical protein CM15mP32_1860 [Flavobacteriaceae bacterium]|nr:MAG: hypothetical protein CM15mP32_1860 [Flavobacteriaceae bacterium]